MDNFNTKIITLKQNIVNLIGGSELPVGVVYYILKDLYDDITNAYNQSLALEQSLLENSSQEETEENKEDVVEEINEN
jgi:hypothetical protein